MRQLPLSKLSQELGVNKSKLRYYCEFGFITPTSLVSNVQIFDADKVKRTVKLIEKLKKAGKTLEEIRDTLK
jgi:DNA-binding transcriptional MerR regulator